MDVDQVPSDDVSNKLDIDELFAFGGVCSKWRESFKRLWGHFMASQAPLVVQKTEQSERAISFFSISDGKSYNTMLPEITGLSFSQYQGFSSGYLIMVSEVNSTLLLVNPFMRRIKEIPKPPNLDGYTIRNVCFRSMLAFAVDSEEFVIVSLSCLHPMNLYVYQSRNSYWENYPSTSEGFWYVVDVVFLHRTLYALDVTGKILSLNSPKLKSLQLNNAPRLSFFKAKLVSSEGQLLVVRFSYLELVNEFTIFRIDFSTMEWIKVESLGDRALFWSDSKCYALSNPSSWGYDSNCMYYIDNKSLTCKVYSMTNELIKEILLVMNQPQRDNLYAVDWYFRHLRDEVDYSQDG